MIYPKFKDEINLRSLMINLNRKQSLKKEYALNMLHIKSSLISIKRKSLRR